MDVTPAPSPSLTPEAIQSQLNRILASSHFSAAARLSAFLQFVVTSAVAGRSGEIKEYTIATEVFGRPESFDSRLDTIVRVQASKLRSRLAEYYAGSGVEDPVLIDLPRGSYVPAIRARQSGGQVDQTIPATGPTPLAPGRRRIWLVVAVAASAVVVIALLARAVAERSDGLTLRHGVAVLPFANLSGDPADEYFSEGLTQDLIGALTRIDGLRVPGQTSPPYPGDRPPDVRALGRQLNVGAVLEGSTRKAGDRVRVVARLVDARSGDVLWSADYERPLRDIFAVQVEISSSIVNALRIQVSGGAARFRVRPQPSSLEAYSLYLKGRFHSHSRAGEWSQDRTAAEYFEEAIRKDPAYGPAYAGLAEWYTSEQARELPDDQALVKAKNAAEKALSLDESLADAHSALGKAHMWGWQWQNAEKEFRRAIELNPGYSVAHLNYSRMLMYQGRFEEALGEAERARDLDPMPSAVTLQVALVDYYARRYEAARRGFQRVLDAEPESIPARHCLGTVFARQGRYADAIAMFRGINPPDVPVAAGNLRALAHTYAAAGQRRDASDVLAKLKDISTVNAPGVYLDWNLALAYAGFGDLENAFAHLNAALYRHERALVVLKVEPLADNLRADPRYAALLRQIGLP